MLIRRDILASCLRTLRLECAVFAERCLGLHLGRRSALPPRPLIGLRLQTGVSLTLLRDSKLQNGLLAFYRLLSMDHEAHAHGVRPISDCVTAMVCKLPFCIRATLELCMVLPVLADTFFSSAALGTVCPHHLTVKNLSILATKSHGKGTPRPGAHAARYTQTLFLTHRVQMYQGLPEVGQARGLSHRHRNLRVCNMWCAYSLCLAMCRCARSRIRITRCMRPLLWDHIGLFFYFYISKL